MAIEEKAINTIVASLLKKQHGLTTAPEKRIKQGQPDITIAVNQQSPMRVMAEAKIGTKNQHKKSASRDAARRIKDIPYCQSAFALCYPEDIGKGEDLLQTEQRLQNEKELLFARVLDSNTTSSWQKGSVTDFAEAIKSAYEDNSAAVTALLRNAIENATSTVTEAMSRKLAKTLSLYDPKEGESNRKGAKIAFLILANTMLIQNRLHGVGIVPNLVSLSNIVHNPDAIQNLRTSWELIRQVNYTPVINPAIALLDELGTSNPATQQIKILLEAAINCETLVQGLRLDHAGPLYHTLLASSRYDGSFYTSTPAALILAHLAMPKDWNQQDWSNPEKVANLKVCDPACGTGTLLMATADTLLNRFANAKPTATSEEKDELFRNIVEQVLYAFDINQHAIHLAAAMLTVSAPTVNYNHTNIRVAAHGITDNGTAAGSLGLLTSRKDLLIPEVRPQTQTQRIQAKGTTEDIPNIEKKIDIVIMNPPFTRNDIRNRQHDPKTRAKIQKHEIEIAQSTKDTLHRKAIDQTTIGTFFTPIADTLTKSDNGTIAMVKPTTFCCNTSGIGERRLLTTRFHIETIITSHDNNRIFFSENTNIHECLIVARRLSQENQQEPTRFINLLKNPATADDATALAKAIEKALAGSPTDLTRWGTYKDWPYERMVSHPWFPATFYSDELTDAAWSLINNPEFTQLGNIAKVEPAGQAIRGTFNRAEARQKMQAFWDHKTDIRTTMEEKPDQYIVPKDNKEKQAKALWDKAGNLLICNKIRLNLVRTPALYSNTKALGSAFIPVHPIDIKNRTHIEKALCMWFNSTPGILSILAIRSKNLTYPAFSLDNLRNLPVPSTQSWNVEQLAKVFDSLKNQDLKALPEIKTDPVRLAIDKAIAQNVKSITWKELADWRTLIVKEPSVHDKKEQPFELT